MRHILLGILAAAVVGMKLVAAQPSGGGPVVERLDPALDEILLVDATLDVIKQDYFGAAEGPTWVSETGGGYLAFSDMGADRIYKWDPVARQLSVLHAGAGYTGSDLTRVRALDNGRLMVALLGTNGLDVDLDGRLVFCAHGDRALGRMEADGTRTILADRFEGKRFNGPNDLVVKSDGSIYFTDLGAPLLGGFANSPDRELDFRGVFRWTSDGAVQLISRDLGNGIAFSPDEAHLYVTGAGVTRFDVMPDGSVTNGQVHVQRSADGVRVDAHGFLYGGGGGAASGSPVRTATCSALSERRIWRVTRSPTSRSGTPTARGCTSVRCAVCSMSGWNVRPGRSRGPTPASRSGSVRCGPEPLVQEPLDPLSVDAFAHIQVAA